MDNKNAVQTALREVLALVSDADGRAMMGRRGPPQSVSVEVEAEPKCEACARGECMDPDHASEDDLSAMMED